MGSGEVFPSSQPRNYGYKPGFAAALMAKDLRLSLEAEAAAGAPPALGKHATDLYQNFVNTGNGGVDFSDIINAIGGDA